MVNNIKNIKIYLPCIFELALFKTIKTDIDVLKRGRSERLFVHILACNIQNIINDLFRKDNFLSVDPFYNKHINKSKKILNNSIEADLVIHKRGNDDFNFLVAEIEINNNPIGDDIWKIREMTKDCGEYKYQFGLYLVLGVEDKAGEIIKKDWYANGKLIKL